MTLLEDARRLVKAGHRKSEGGHLYCVRCRAHLCSVPTEECEEPDWEDHGPACPWLAMPRIVAALEAAEAVIAAHAYPPAAYDEWQALVAALRGIS